MKASAVPDSSRSQKQIVTIDSDDSDGIEEIASPVAKKREAPAKSSEKGKAKAVEHVEGSGTLIVFLTVQSAERSAV